MKLENLDIFSSQFQLNVQNDQKKKKSCIGGLLSIIVISLSLAYFIYLCFQYIQNQIEPKYKNQYAIVEERNKIDFDDTFIGYNYMVTNNKTLVQLENEQNKTYFVYLSYLYIQTESESEFIPIPSVDCTTSQLQKYQCFDLQNIKNKSLVLDTKQNSKVNLILTLFKCTDTDMFKTTIPPNCASEEEIDEILNNSIGTFHMKMFTSQYNTTSQKMQVSYKNFDVHLQGDNLVFTRLKAIKQTTTVKQGPFIQSETQFSSAIDYIKDERAFNREKLIQTTGQKLILQVIIDVAEQVQQIKIQYPTFLEILAIFNSVLSVLLGLGYIGRYFSRRIIQEEISIILLQQIYQKDYLKLIGLNKQSKQHDTIKKNPNMTKKKQENIVKMSLPQNELQNKQCKKLNDIPSNQDKLNIRQDTYLLKTQQTQIEQEDMQTEKSEFVLKITDRNIKKYDKLANKLNNLNKKIYNPFKKPEAIIQSSRSEYAINSLNNLDNLMNESPDKVVLPNSQVNTSLYYLNDYYEKDQQILQSQQVTTTQSLSQIPQILLKKQSSIQLSSRQYQNNNIISKSTLTLNKNSQNQSNPSSPLMKSIPKNILFMKRRKNSSQTLIDSEQSEISDINDYTYQNQLNHINQIYTQQIDQYIHATDLIFNETFSYSNSLNNQNSTSIEQKPIKKQIAFINKPSNISKTKKNIISSQIQKQNIQNNQDQQQSTKTIAQICSDNISDIQNDKLASKLQKSIFSRFFGGQKKEFIAEVKSKKLKQFMEEKTNNQLNVQQLFKDIILLKKAIMVILSNDQFAALQLTGCTLEYLKKGQIKDENFKESHLDKQMSIYHSQQKQIQYIQDFLKRTKDKDSINEIDERLLTSMTI